MGWGFSIKQRYTYDDLEVLRQRAKRFIAKHHLSDEIDEYASDPIQQLEGAFPLADQDERQERLSWLWDAAKTRFFREKSVDLHFPENDARAYCYRGKYTE